MMRLQPFPARFSHIAAPMPREAPWGWLLVEVFLEVKMVAVYSDDGELSLEDGCESGVCGRHFY